MRVPLAAILCVLLCWAKDSSLAGPVPVIIQWQVSPGTRALLYEDHRVPLVSLVLDFPAGTFSPWGQKNHIEEAFEIQLHDGAWALRRRANQLAVEVSLKAGERSSELRLSCLKEDLPAALALLRDLLGNRDFDGRELSRRRRSRSLLFAGQEKDPRFRLGQAGARLLLATGDPRRRRWEEPDRLLTDSKRLAAARDMLVRLPGRLIGLGGDLDRAEAERLARGLLPPEIARPPADLQPVFLPFTDAARRPRESRVLMKGLTQVHLVYARPALGVTDPEYPALLLANHVLGGSPLSRLGVALREQEGDTYSAGTSNPQDTVPRGYALFTYTRAANKQGALRKLSATLRTFHKGGITEQERRDAAGYLQGETAFYRQSPEQVLSNALWEIRRGLPPGYLDALGDRAAAVPLAQVNAFISRFYDPGRFSLVTVAPKD